MINTPSLTITPETIADFLKRDLRVKEIYQKILYEQIVDRAVQEHGITVTPEEIQAEADRQRYQKQLESAAATYAWLEDQMITAEDWEAGIRSQLYFQKLAGSLFATEVEKYFAEHRLDFEQVSLYRISVPYPQLAQELFYQIEEHEIGFYEAAHLYDIDETRRLHCGYDGCFYRWSLDPATAALVFGAQPGKVLGPVQTEHSFDLLRVEAFIPAQLTSPVHQLILDRLFQEWLDSEVNYWLYR